MSIYIDWFADERFPEKSLIHWRFAAGWTWQDFKILEAEAASLFGQVSHKVHTLAQFMPQAGAPSGGATPILTRTIRHPHPNCGFVAAIDLPIALMGTESLLRRMVPRLSERLISAVSLDNALYEIISRQSRL